MIEIISATRHDEKFFREQSPLGISLKRLSFDIRLKPFITFNNSTAIGEIYNRRITSQGSSFDVLVFVAVFEKNGMRLTGRKKRSIPLRHEKKTSFLLVAVAIFLYK